MRGEERKGEERRMREKSRPEAPTTAKSSGEREALQLARGVGSSSQGR